MQCPVLDLAYDAVSLRTCYALPGTELVYGDACATQCPARAIQRHSGNARIPALQTGTIPSLCTVSGPEVRDILICICYAEAGTEMAGTEMGMPVPGRVRAVQIAAPAGEEGEGGGAAGEARAGQKGTIPAMLLHPEIKHKKPLSCISYPVRSYAKPGTHIPCPICDGWHQDKENDKASGGRPVPLKRAASHRPAGTLLLLKPRTLLPIENHAAPYLHCAVFPYLTYVFDTAPAGAAGRVRVPVRSQSDSKVLVPKTASRGLKGCGDSRALRD
eukprot:168921-Rhodomonas_salina.1